MERLRRELGEPDTSIGGWSVEQVCSVSFPATAKGDVEELMVHVLQAVQGPGEEEDATLSALLVKKLWLLFFFLLFLFLVSHSCFARGTSCQQHFYGGLICFKMTLTSFSL